MSDQGKFHNRIKRNTDTCLHLYIYIGLFCLALATSCNNSKNKGKESQNVQHPSPDTMAYTMKELYEFSPYFSQSGESIDTTYFRARYPYSNNEHFNKLVLESMDAQDEEDLKTLATNFLTEYDNYAEESPSPEHIHSWFHSVSCQIYLYTPRILAIGTRTDEYTGGAHGNYFELLSNYDLKNWKRISLSDIILKDKTKEFLNIAEKYFRDHEGLAKDASLEKDYFFENGVFTLADNFCFSKDALVFQYNPYEIKAYYEGMTTIRIPYKALNELLTPEGKTYIDEITTYFN